MLFLQPLAYNTVFAHNSNNASDPPGPSSPKIKVTVTLDSIKLNQSMDDPTEEGDAELVLSYAFNHMGHEESVSGNKEIDFNYMIYTLTRCYSEARPDKYWTCYRFLPNPEMTFRTPIKLYEHVECTPMSQMAYSFDLRESDQSAANTVASGTFTVVGALAAIPAFGWTTAGVVAAVGSLTTFIIGLNGDEHLGIQIGVQQNPQTNIVTQLNGADGSAEIKWSVKTETVPDPEGQCGIEQKQVGSLIDKRNSQQDQYALAETVDKFILASKETILLNPLSEKEEGIVETTDSEFEELKNETPSKVLGFTKNLYGILTSSKSDSQSDTYAILTEADLLASQKKYDEALDVYKRAILKSVGTGNEIKYNAIPGWIKQNAKWWSEDTITDADFASGIGFLAMHGIITTSMETNVDGTILVNENLSIPGWIKQNAKWWSEGTITDADFVSGINYMISKKIITFSEPSTMRHTPALSNAKLKELYVIGKQSEAITASLIEITMYQRQTFYNAVDDAWEKYEQTQEQSYLKVAQRIDAELKDAEKRAQSLSKTQSLAKQGTQNLVKNAAKYGLAQFDFDNAARGKIMSVSKIDTHQKMRDAIAGLENANKQNIKGLESVLELPSGKILDDLVWGEGAKPGSITGKITKILSSTTGPDFIRDYYGVSDHLPVSAVFDDNWSATKDVKEDMQVILEIEGYGQVEKEQGKDDIKTEPIVEQEDGRQVAVLVVGGKHYPLSQFVEVPAHEPNCDALHYHSEISPVVSSDGTVMADPNPSTCGFGKVGLVPVEVIMMTQEQINAFREATGFEP